MAKPYSNDLRQRVAAAIASGDSCRAIAELYEIAPSTVVKWSKRLRETGSAAPAKFGGQRSGNVTVRERGAWTWARKHALVWTPRMEKQRRNQP